MKKAESNTGIIIQARVGSTRLKEKMIKPFYGDYSILEILLQRFKKDAPDYIPFVIATTNKPSDDAIEKVANNYQVPVFRGSDEDVLQRFIDTAKHFRFHRIIRICADNPLMDVIGTMQLDEPNSQEDWDYIGFKVGDNKPSITSHLGFWGEWVTLKALEKIKHFTNERFYHEHVTNYIYMHPEIFNIRWENAPNVVFNRSDIRLTVDRQEDFELVAEIYKILKSLNLTLNIDNIIHIIDEHPEFLKRMAVQIKLNQK